MKTIPSVAVVVGRFQVPTLHDGHRFLLDHAAASAERLMVVIGTTGTLPSTPRNPLSYEMRKHMVEREYPSAIIAPLPDHPSDTQWCRNLDALIAAAFPGSPAVLWGSRDSFLKCYAGTYPTQLIAEHGHSCGTKAREMIANTVVPSATFRRGVIHAHATRFPMNYPTVDIAVMRDETGEVLLAHKQVDGEKWRFPGGFVDRHDSSLEAAARRELIEEVTHIETADWRYIGSHRVDDWRYRGSGDGIITSFFAARYIFGAPQPRDDIDGARWVSLADLPHVLVDAHRPLGDMLLTSLGTAPRYEGPQRTFSF